MADKEYAGSKKGCDFCGIPFEPEVMILCDYQQNLIFCFPEAGLATPSCATRWAFANGKMIIGEPAIFRGGKELPGYGGSLDSCAGCGCSFEYGQTILVDGVRQVALCFESIEDCAEQWKDLLGQPEAVFQGEKFRFHGNT